MEIKRIEKGGGGAFIIREDGERLAELTYVNVGETGFIIDHTEVTENLRGQNVGEDLVDAAVKYAREKDLKIFATCPFAIRVLSSREDVSDIYSG